MIILQTELKKMFSKDKQEKAWILLLVTSHINIQSFICECDFILTDFWFYQIYLHLNGSSHWRYIMTLSFKRSFSALLALSLICSCISPTLLYMIWVRFVRLHKLLPLVLIQLLYLSQSCLLNLKQICIPSGMPSLYKGGLWSWNPFHWVL